MKSILLVLTIFLSFYLANAQKIIKKEFCINELGEVTKYEKNANFIKLTIKEPDRIKRYEIRDIKTNKLVSSKIYKKNEQVGKWLTAEGKVLDYDFDLKYTKKEYENLIKYDIYLKSVTGNFKGEFEAPVFPKFNNNFRLFVAENLIYPEKALDKDIQGKTTSQFIIDENGKLIKLSNLKSAHKILDKEAARAILESPEWIPAKLDGKPIPVHIIIHNIFFFTEEEDF